MSLFLSKKTFESLPDELEQQKIIGRVCSTPSDKSTVGSKLSIPLIVISKEDTIKVVPDARHSISQTDQAFDFWPLEHFDT